MVQTETKNVSPEGLTFPDLNVDVLSESEFTNIKPSLEWYRALVYALYTENGEPTEITTAKPPNHTTANYIIAYHPDLSQHMNPGSNPILQKLSPHFVPYQDVAGLFRLEIGKTSAGSLPIEAMELMHYPGWPLDAKIGYFSQFSPNPLLPKPLRHHVLHQLFTKASKIVHKEGFADHAYVILADKVLTFVQEAGITATLQPGASLNWSNPEAANIFRTWPGYWLHGDPQLYKFTPF